MSARHGYGVLWSLASTLLLLILFLLIAVYFYAKTLPDLSYWHLDETVDEYQLKLDLQEIESFEQYLLEEEQLFKRLHQLTQDMPDSTPAQWSRFHPTSQLNSHQHPINWNRSFVLEPESPRAGVVLVHGLSDSPYSLRALAERLRSDNILVVGLRVPGHGTLPAALRETDRHDFRAAVSLSARWINRKLPEGRPFYMVGYSNGAALITDYSLSAMTDKSLRVPDRLIMMSPAMKVDSIAFFAKGQRLISELPGMDKLAWLDVITEYDPFKYNSFPVAAGEQIYKLTNSLQQRLKEKYHSNQLSAFPPVLAFQSMVDATIPPDAIVTGLMDYLVSADSQLVLFNVNASSVVAPMLRTGHERWMERLRQRSQTHYDLKIIRNRSADSSYVEELFRPANDTTWQQQDLPLQWPPSVYSLSHIALSFAANDPWYGVEGEGDGNGSEVLRLGSIEKRGERGVFGVSMDQLSRLRYNPFYSYIEQTVFRFIADNPGG